MEMYSYKLSIEIKKDNPKIQYRKTDINTFIDALRDSELVSEPIFNQVYDVLVNRISIEKPFERTIYLICMWKWCSGEKLDLAKTITSFSEISFDYESGQCKVLNNNDLDYFPILRRSYLRDDFYNTASLPPDIREGSKVEVKFKRKTETYVVHRIYYTCGRYLPSITLIKEKYLDDWIDNKTNFLEYSERWTGGLSLKKRYSKDVLFVIDEMEVTDALSNLYDCNKHYLRGYQNKTIKIKTINEL